MKSMTLAEMRNLLSGVFLLLGNTYPEKNRLRVAAINNTKFNSLAFKDTLSFDFLMPIKGESSSGDVIYIDTTGCDQWEAATEYQLNQIIWYDTHVYQVTKITPPQSAGTGQTGTSQPSISRLKIGDTVTDGTMTAMYCGTPSGWVKPNTVYIRNEGAYNSPYAVICDTPGTTGSSVPGAYDNDGWDSGKTGFASGTAHFKIASNKLAWWSSSKTLNDGQAVVLNGALLIYHATNQISSTPLTGSIAPSFTSGSANNGDYTLTYLGEVKR